LEWSKELAAVVDESRAIAGRLSHAHTSAHVLICLFTVTNQASEFLIDRDVTLEGLLDAIQEKPVEPGDLFSRVQRRAEEVARVSRSSQVNSLHVLVALCSFVDSAAYRLMEQVEVDVAQIRNLALGRLARQQEPELEAATGPHAFIHVDRNPSRPTRQLGANGSGDPLGIPRPVRPAAPPVPAAEPDDAASDDGPPTARGLREPDDVRRRRRAMDRPGHDAPEHDGRDTERTLAARLKESDKGPAPSRPPARPLDAPVAAPSPAAAWSRPLARSIPLPPTVNRVAAPGTAGTVAADGKVKRHQLVLRDMQFPLLCKHGRNLSLLAFDGKIDPVVGRDDEIERLVDILNKRRTNNPLLLGDPGVGKTAVVEGLARWIVGADGTRPVPGLEGRIVVELEASKMIAGTGLRGAFSERIQQLKQEVAAGAGRVIVFLDEIHQWIGMGGGGDGASDGAGELKTALARGEFACIGATTFDEYRTFVETDAAFARRFQTVRVEEPTPQAAISILQGVKSQYEAHHGVTFSEDALEAAVRLSHRYIQDRRLPDKALGALDLAGSRARRRGLDAVDRALVTTVVAEQAGLSPEKLLMADREKMLRLEELLAGRIVGHRDIIARVSQILRRNYAGFVSQRPVGSLLFLGPTGVGKTELAKALAEVLFHHESAMLRFDMSEFMESHAVARLIGSPPGYVGHDQGGQLTESVRRRPYQLVLLDEIEKAHPDVLNLLIQILDEGRLTDSRGRTVDFSSTLIVMTSNLGAAEVTRGPERRVGFSGAEQGGLSDRDARRDRVVQAARSHFSPELWARIDEPLVFFSLSQDEVAHIARLQLARSSARLGSERRIHYRWSDELVTHLVASGGFDPALGARPMRRTIERLVEAPIAELILSGTGEAPATVLVSVEDGQVVASVEPLRSSA
jgi:ATP-dependent Clp protease ATP-binding subunit ClpC